VQSARVIVAWSAVPQVLPSVSGEGGGVQQWRLHASGGQSPEALPGLPAARFGGIEFPNIAQLALAGQGRMLGCSSAGSVALWDTARYACCSDGPAYLSDQGCIAGASLMLSNDLIEM
jgi:hypothetical protein